MFFGWILARLVTGWNVFWFVTGFLALVFVYPVFTLVVVGILLVLILLDILVHSRRHRENMKHVADKHREKYGKDPEPWTGPNNHRRPAA